MNMKKKRTYPMSIYAIILILIVIAVIFFFSDSQVRHSKHANRRIHAFYYSHWGTPDINGKWFGWNAQNLAPTVPDYILDRFKPIPPKQMSTSYYPKLGPYSSSDPKVIQTHMKQIVQSHVGVIVLGWIRPGKNNEDFLTAGYENETISLIMDEAHKNNIKVCFHMLHYTDQTDEMLYEDIQFIFENYAQHPAFYLTEDFDVPKGINGKPIFYIEGVQYRPPSFWKSLFSKSEDKKGRLREKYDAVYIAKLIAEQQLNIISKSGFDGIYTWHGSHISSPVANPLKWRDLSFWAETNGLLFAPTVSPGYNSFKYNLGYTLHVTERKKGATYEDSWKMAIESNAPIISINSFNQWHLGTQIEPAVSKIIKDNERDYLDYEGGSTDMYLDLTRKWASKYSFFLSTNKNRDFFFAEKKQ